MSRFVQRLFRRRGRSVGRLGHSRRGRVPPDTADVYFIRCPKIEAVNGCLTDLSEHYETTSGVQEGKDSRIVARPR